MNREVEAFLGAELRVMQSAVHAADRDEFLMRALLGDALFRDDDDAVRILDRRESMGNDERRAALRQLGQRLLNRRFGLRIQRRCRLIENENRRILQEHARNREALLLPAGELDAALSDDRIQSLRLRLDKLLQLRAPRASQISSSVASKLAVRDVLPHRAGEQEHILLHDADLAAQRFQLDIANIDAVNGDAARADIVEARQQGCRSSFCLRRKDRRKQPFPPHEWTG